MAQVESPETELWVFHHADARATPSQLQPLHLQNQEPREPSQTDGSLGGRAREKAPGTEWVRVKCS